MATTVMHLITELDSGGAQSALLRLVAGQDRSRFTPVVLCLYNGDRLVAQQIRSLGVEVIDLGMTRKWRLDAFWRLWRHCTPGCSMPTFRGVCWGGWLACRILFHPSAPWARKAAPAVC